LPNPAAGTTLPNSKLKQAATGMLVTHDVESDLFQAFVLCGESLVMVTSKGENKELGTFKNGVYTSAKSAQDVYHIHNYGHWHGNLGSWTNYGNYNRGRIGGNYGNLGTFGSNNRYGSSGLGLWYTWRYYLL
jgi:hypothetical protein